MGISDPDYLAIGQTMFPKGVYGVSHSFSEVGPSYRAGNPDGLAEWVKLDAVGWQGGAVRQQTDRPITFARIEAELRVPTLLITGDADLMMPPSRMRGVRPHMPHAELAIVAEAGHSLHWEQPEAFNRAVLDFIGRH
jgi:pimeloyl-ACP methyl ester carboxylesterase